MVKVEMPGYETKVVPLVQDWNWAAIVLEGFFLGVVPVFFNGKEHREEYVVELTPGGSDPSSPPEAGSSDSTAPLDQESPNLSAVHK